MASLASERLVLRGSDIGWPVEELWVTGDLLSLADVVDGGSVVVVLDFAVDELPWLALHPSGAWINEQLRLGKRPMQWCFRPVAWPAWNHQNRRLVRFWSADGGLDEAAMAALKDRRLDRVRVVEPSGGELVDQLGEELAVSRRYLRDVLDRYWDQSWRRGHKAFDELPEDHLWRAAQAVREIEDALD